MIALSILLKASLVVLAAAGLERALARRVSAASRHLIWTLTCAAVLLLPVFTLSLPPWTAVSLPQWTAVTWDAPAVSIAPSSPQASQPASSAPRPDLFSGSAGATRAAAPTERLNGVPWSAVSLTAVLLGIYAAGIVLLFGRLAAERLTLRRLVREAIPVSDPAWTTLLDECARALRLRRGVRLLRSAEPMMPMACGIWRSSVLLPQDADDWSEDRRRAVLLHELAHVARFDCLTQTLAAVASALYWPHPGVWWMARRLRVERELACDDCVLAAGADARAYAGHLLEIAYSLGTGRTPALAVAMAGSRQLEGRMLAVLDAARHRTPPALRGRLAAVVLMLAVVVPIAVVTARAVPDSGSAPPAASAVGDADADSQVDPIDESGPGTWELRPSRNAGVMYLTLSHRNGRHGNTIAVSELSGLEPDALVGGGPIRFSRRNDAGSFDFEGVARNGVAAGTYEFAPNASFSEQLARRGLARPTPAQQQVLARQDIGLAFLDQVTNAAASPTLEQLMQAAQQGVDPDFIKGLREAGFESLPLDELMRLRRQGVDAEYIQELRALGHGALTLDQLIALRRTGVDAEYISELAELGHKSLSLEDLTNLRRQGVDADYIRELADLGHKSLSLEDLTNLRRQGVDADYIRELGDLGHKGLSLDRLAELRSHGVDADYIRGMSELTGEKLSLERLIELRRRGVDPDEIRELRSLTQPRR